MKEAAQTYLARPKLAPLAVAAAFFGVVAAVSLDAESFGEEALGFEPPVTPQIGEALFTSYLGAFEAVAVLLVAALVAGVYLAKPGESREDRLEDTVESKLRTDAPEAQESLDRRRADTEDEDGSD